MPPAHEVAPGMLPLGVILAGGAGRRMGGGDKALLVLGGRSLLSRVIERLGPQCDGLILNANGDPTRFAASGLAIVPDDLPERPGPLAGVLAALDWAAAHRPEIRDVVSVAADTPFLPRDLVARLGAARAATGTAMACAASGDRLHPVNALWPVALRGALRRTLVEDGLRRMERVMERHGAAEAAWPDRPYDPFLNVNTPADLAAAEALAAVTGET